MDPAHSTTKGVGPTTQATPPAWPANPPLLSPHLRAKLILPQGARESVTCFPLPPAAAEVPIKTCLNFSSGLWSISIDKGGQEPWSVTLVHNKWHFGKHASSWQMNKHANKATLLGCSKEALRNKAWITWYNNSPFLKRRPKPLKKESWRRNYSRNCIFSPVC